MKWHGVLKSVVLSLILCLNLTPGRAVEKSPVKARTSFTIFSVAPSRPSVLMAQRVLQHAYQELGISIRFVEVPILRSRVMWNNGSLDAVAFKLIDEGLPQALKISIPINFEDIVIFTTKTEIKAHGYADLQNYTVGYLGGVQLLEDRLRDIPQTDVAPNLESLFKKLAVGRTEVVVDSRYSLCVAQRLGLHNVQIREPSLEKRLGYHFIHQRHAELAKSLERIILQMENDGAIKRIQDEVMREYQQTCKK